ncbi:uncharacterized protein E0L32_004732 [Thyridium curvatum]|uniref:FAD-binding FR-type domain-containing protein n=1 Tax=Thyridium curvatum TaxID=1093900 RepID=A0A507B981_9PEZI|nr:uncharacterized protein E0L32_004732 [Thyridium curvatum]TPX15174.1 hypothetical protein E0L32_004732 [Thyridium curvatum]
MSGSKTSHQERTAHEPRGEGLHTVILSRIDQINDTIRILRLSIPDGAPEIKLTRLPLTPSGQFLPGQWLDTFCPGVPKAGGFTITSQPSLARRPSSSSSSSPAAPAATAAGYLELAVQRSPDNPAAAWLWREDQSAILGRELRIRVGGSFVYPPVRRRHHHHLHQGAADEEPVLLPHRRAVFVAGGVGVNPLVSMVAHIAEQQQQQRRRQGKASGGGRSPDSDDGGVVVEVHLLYSMKDPGPGRRDASKMLFVERLVGLFGRREVRGRMTLFLTGHDGEDADGGGDPKQSDKAVAGIGPDVPVLSRRIELSDIVAAMGGPGSTDSAVVYVCGLPTMTDSLVEELTSADGLGMEKDRVLYEKWW